MPRGFLVKRLPSSKHSAPSSYRVRRYSDEDRSDSSSDHDGPSVAASAAATVVVPQPPHSSPDSGFGSPTFLLAYRTTPRLDYESTADVRGHSATDNVRHFYHRHNNNNNNDNVVDNNNDIVQGNNSPLALTTRPSPPPPPSSVYLSGFDQLMVTLCSTPPSNKSPAALTVPPPSPHKRRGGDAADGGSGGGPKGFRAPKKSKAVRRLTFDEDKTSPVSGTIIRDFDGDDDTTTQSSMLVVRKGDIDPSFNVVEATDEAKAEIAKIENRIGDYICQLCKKCYDDAFGLAQHRCSRIVHVEYRCPECDKVFNCPANLASHRRWHKPRPTPAQTTIVPTSRPSVTPHLPPPPRLLSAVTETSAVALSDSEASNSSLSHPCSPNQSDTNADELYECDLCNKKFRRQAYLRKHLTSHAKTLDVTSSTPGDHAANPAFSAPDVAANGLTTDVGGPFTCKYCANTFATSPGLTRHINKFHPSETRQVILLQLPQH